MSCSCCLRLLCCRLAPVLVVFLAVAVGWLASHEQPEGVFFATVIPLAKGIAPATLVGHGKMIGTPPVPASLRPAPRPAKEMFLELPSGSAWSSGDQMPMNGLGMCCRPTAYDDELVTRSVLWFLLKGGRHIDTAQLYLNHRAIGEGIRQAMARGIPRSEIFVTTKVFPRSFGREAAVHAVAAFLEELQLDYLDLVLLHMPRTFPTMTTECSAKGLDHATCRAETWRALSAARSLGLVRNAGVSNFTPKQMDELRSLQPDNDGTLSVIAPIAANQMQFNPWAPDHSVETFEYCQRSGIAVMAYASLAGFMQKAAAFTTASLAKIATGHRVTVAQVLLRWALQVNAAVIPGTGNPKHMDENLAVYNFELTEEEMATIKGLSGDEAAKSFFYMAADDS